LHVKRQGVKERPDSETNSDAEEDGERTELQRVVNAASSEVRMVERARIVLCASEGLKGAEIAERVGCSLPTVVKWRGR
jgi:DNA-directed RNA polymerase specialized sigma24 family protein